MHMLCHLFSFISYFFCFLFLYNKISLSKLSNFNQGKTTPSKFEYLVYVATIVVGHGNTYAMLIFGFIPIPYKIKPWDIILIDASPFNRYAIFPLGFRLHSFLFVIVLDLG